MLSGVWVLRTTAMLVLLATACAGRSGRSIDGSSGGASGSSIGGTGGQGGAAGSSGGAAGAEGGAAGDDGGSVGNAGGEAGASGSSSSTGGATGATGGSSGEAGSAGSGGFSGGSGGSGGQIDPTPRPCNSADGSGCEPGEVCLAVAMDSCESTSDCGLCGPALPRSTCEVDLAQCTGTVTCPAIPGECPSGFVHSIVDECFGPCVPVDCCACTSDFDCQLDDGSCDRATGRCVVPAAPEPRCFLPFDPDACATNARVFAFIDGHCQEQMGAFCGVNANSFFTLEECLRRCEGLPQQSECPEGRVSRTVCLECGLGGGCARMNTVCAKTCSTMDDCEPGEGCTDGACGATGCI
jgi:hypothetical protein